MVYIIVNQLSLHMKGKMVLYVLGLTIFSVHRQSQNRRMVLRKLVDCDCITLESSGSVAIDIFGSVGKTSEVLGESFLAYFRRNLWSGGTSSCKNKQASGGYSFGVKSVSDPMA